MLKLSLKTSRTIPVVRLSKNISKTTSQIKKVICDLKNNKAAGGEILFSVRHQGVNDSFALTSMIVFSFSDCQKHEDITLKTLQ